MSLRISRQFLEKSSLFRLDGSIVAILILVFCLYFANSNSQLMTSIIDFISDLPNLERKSLESKGSSEEPP